MMFRRVVVKVGASVLTDAGGWVDNAALGRIVEQLAAAVAAHRQVILVSSGAIACGMAQLGLLRRPKELMQLQACAAVGQGQLMHRYSEAFGRHGLVAAQILLTEADLGSRARCRNARNTLTTLLARHVVPIVNENDTVAVEEITFGDNDRLAALVAALVQAELLVILSDVDGLLRDGQVVPRVDDVADSHRLIVQSSRHTTTGGMASKLSAGRLCRHAGIPMVIANGTTPDVLTEILAGKPVGTLIAPPRVRLTSHKWWIAFSTRKPLGEIVIDDGAARALVHGGKSLLASGVQTVRGRFHAGDAVAVVHTGQGELARGVSNFSSGDVARIRGLSSRQIAETLGVASPAEVIHRNNLVLTRELL